MTGFVVKGHIYLFMKKNANYIFTLVVSDFVDPTVDLRIWHLCIFIFILAYKVLVWPKKKKKV